MECVALLVSEYLDKNLAPAAEKPSIKFSEVSESGKGKRVTPKTEPKDVHPIFQAVASGDVEEISELLKKEPGCENTV